jgi:hypothetical protein
MDRLKWNENIASLVVKFSNKNIFVHGVIFQPKEIFPQLFENNIRKKLLEVENFSTKRKIYYRLLKR